jgi:hypothetical protein
MRIPARMARSKAPEVRPLPLCDECNGPHCVIDVNGEAEDSFVEKLSKTFVDRRFDTFTKPFRIDVYFPSQRRAAGLAHLLAEVAELADAHGSGPCTRKGVGVRVPSSAPCTIIFFNLECFLSILLSIGQGVLPRPSQQEL